MKIQPIKNNRLHSSLTGNPGLYIHIPFCGTKCPYCDFYSVTDDSLISSYLAALEQEARLYQGMFGPFDSLYLGGGTPSLLTSYQLAPLMKNLRRHFPFALDCEITLEANPDDITAEKLLIYRDLGVNRFSLGVQSFDEGELRFLGRRHTAEQTETVIDLIRAAGFDNLGLDLIYGLPGQSLDAWIRSLEKALGFAPEHLSCYQLTLAESTPMGRAAAADQLDPLDEESQRAFFLFTSRFLKEGGYLHYEVSNFARQEKYRCRHNRKYWTHVPYLGLGPGAHSFTNGKRWWNFSSLARYGAALAAGRGAVAGEERLTPDQLRLEALYLGFRTRDGVSLETLKAHPHWQSVLRELRNEYLVESKNGRVRATDRGLVIAERLPLMFAD